jgi:hypothetical protein
MATTKDVLKAAVLKAAELDNGTLAGALAEAWIYMGSREGKELLAEIDEIWRRQEQRKAA